MKATKLLIPILLVIFNGCKAPQIKLKPRRVWSFNFNKCFCQWYDLNKIEKKTNLVDCNKFFEPIVFDSKYKIRCEEKIFYKKNRHICNIISKKRCDNEKYLKDYPYHCQILTPEEYCNDLVGFNFIDWGNDITPWGREVRRYGDDSCN
jgi:hypothetical protein